MMKRYMRKQKLKTDDNVKSCLRSMETELVMLREYTHDIESIWIFFKMWTTVLINQYIPILTSRGNRIKNRQHMCISTGT